ncbi:hypothetical protein NC651_037298 [Populus alba x Populus x berolinensis]|nr:hypothetical protein NC651_037298 [Populus alba x Populus x berolinensis]
MEMPIFMTLAARMTPLLTRIRSDASDTLILSRELVMCDPSHAEKRVYVALHVGDVIRFGHSSQLYIFQGPSDLMPLDDGDEVAWHTYKGQLTEKQEKTRDKIIKSVKSKWLYGLLMEKKQTFHHRFICRSFPDFLVSAE